MTVYLTSVVRRLVVTVTACGVLTVSMNGVGSAQMRAEIKNRVVDDVANTLVSRIQSESCADFAVTLKKSKSGGTSSTRASGMMKKDPTARARFVDKVAGPLVNKMIDCDLLPGK